MKNDQIILVIIAVFAIGLFYYFGQKKPTLSVQLTNDDGNLNAKGTKENPVTNEDINAVKDLLTQLIQIKEAQTF